MKVNFQGYEIECTPEEFNALLKMQDKGSVKFSPPPYSPYETGTPWWGIFPPPQITCGDSFKATSDGTLTVTCSNVDAKDFSEKFVEGLRKKGIQIGRNRA